MSATETLAVEELPDEASGKVRRFERVRIDDLHIDPAYQRDLSLDLVEKIAREYDPSATSAITVARRKNGDLYIVNGQHRSGGAKRAGEEYVVAEVFDGLSPAEEAELRLKGNTRRTDRPLERFKAQVAAGHPESIAIAKIAEEFGTKVNRNPDANKGLNAVSALESIYRYDRNGTMLTRVLEFVQQAFGDAHGPNVKVAVLKAVAFLLERHSDEMDRARMVEKLGQYGVSGIHRIATAHKGAMGGAMWVNYYRAFIEVYNERLSEGARMEWRTASYTRSKVDNRQTEYGEEKQNATGST